jgi:hypothetical protein
MHRPTDPHRRLRAVARQADTAAAASFLGAVRIIVMLMLTWGAIALAGLH